MQVGRVRSETQIVIVAASRHVITTIDAIRFTHHHMQDSVELEVGLQIAFSLLHRVIGRRGPEPGNSRPVLKHKTNYFLKGWDTANEMPRCASAITFQTIGHSDSSDKISADAADTS